MTSGQLRPIKGPENSTWSTQYLPSILLLNLSFHSCIVMPVPTTRILAQGVSIRLVNTLLQVMHIPCLRPTTQRHTTITIVHNTTLQILNPVAVGICCVSRYGPSH